MNIFRAVFLLNSLSCSRGQYIKNILHHTKLGKIVGEHVLNGTQAGILKFLNIPYAKPPIDELRFAKPKQYGAWNETRNGTIPGPVCIQLSDNPYFIGRMSEDCLNLNIYVPYPLKHTHKRAVMIWIHGGGYIFGSGSYYDGSMLALTGDVIVVTLNYRLGVLGFYCLDEVFVKGNYGLWDQMLALQWVKDNIEDYGGDPKKVTVFGESAGGFSVGLLSLIPKNKGLFHRIILQSGTANSPLAIGSTRKSSDIITDKVGCNGNTKPELIIKCMRNLSVDYIMHAVSNFAKESLTSIHRLIINVFTPVVDGELFKMSSNKIFQNPLSEEYMFFKSLDVMVGNCDMEGSLYLETSEVLTAYGLNITEGIPRDFFCNHLIPTAVADHFNDEPSVMDAMCKEYGENNNIILQSLSLLEWYSDLYFIAPSLSTLLAHSSGNTKNSRRYQFILTERLPVFLGSSTPPWFKGSAHTTDLMFLFFIEDLGSVDPNSEYRPKDSNFMLSTIMRKYWANFAKTGNPNYDDLPDWPPFNSSTQAYVQFSGGVTARTKYRQQKMDFWLKVIPNLFLNSQQTLLVCRYSIYIWCMFNLCCPLLS
ncbi:cocaine esterase-like [Saccostrea echinata]|uniref:cocaine esterase-like n=1 Tax=Saccostrea echinata TaxID=191078 RepID=UPI002A801BDD|nr:cocaine esterase-like [Saccostrea echinata]